MINKQIRFFALILKLTFGKRSGVVDWSLVSFDLLWRLVAKRLVECNHVHRKAEHEDAEDGEEARKVLHQVTDDDGPRAEQVVEAEEVENLHRREQKRDRKKLVAQVHQRRPIRPRNQQPQQMESHPEHTEHQHSHLQTQKHVIFLILAKIIIFTLIQPSPLLSLGFVSSKSSKPDSQTRSAHSYQ